MEDWTTHEGRHPFYMSKEWRSLRIHILTNEPFCRTCKAQGTLEPAVLVDHITDIQDDPERRLDTSNLQPLCWACHNKKTFKSRVPFNKRSATTQMINRLWKMK